MKFFAVLSLVIFLIAAVSAIDLPRLRREPFKFNPLCAKLHSQNGEPMFETTEFTDCTRKGIGAAFIVCKQDEICCPKRTGGSKCVKKVDLGA